MRILHVTDLHLTGKNTSLDDLWAGLDRDPAFRDGFDYVVLSGDLVQKAGPDEYTACRNFIEDRLLPLTSGGDRERVVIVPGNHDVHWCGPANLGTPLDERSHGKHTGSFDKIRRWIDKTAFGAKELRFTVKPNMSGFEWYHLDDPKKYNTARFRNFQNDLIDAFYAERLTSPSQKFKLTSDLDEQHWSAHVFDEVAFYGFSSCHSNDQLGVEADISGSAIRAAARHRERYAKGKLCIAVWHHGLSSERGHADCLKLETLASIRSNGFHVAFHGHTHRAELDDLVGWKKLGGMRRAQPMPIIATGSFAADWEERPEGVWNQVSIVEIEPPHLRWTLFERREHEWNQAHRLQYEVPLPGPERDRPARAPVPAPVWALTGRHERTVDVDADGIAQVSVRIEDLWTTRPIVIARPRAPQLRSRTKADKLIKAGAKVGEVQLTIDSSEQGDMASIPGTPDAPTTAEVLTWSYFVANVFALTKMDCLMQPAPRSSFLTADEDAFVHHVRFPTRQLRLRLKLPVPPEGEPRLVSQRPGAEPLQWETDASESRRHKVTRHDPAPTDPEPERWTIEADLVEPRLGYRYALVYRPGLDRAELSDQVLSPLRQLRDQCLFSEPADEGRLRGLLTAMVDEAIGDALGVKATGCWTAHLWDPDRMELRTAFGRFPPAAWADSFRCGEGIAGHAFRRAGPVIFAKEPAREGSDPRPRTLLYRTRRPLDHEWIICVPLVTLGKGPTPVGVLGLTEFPRVAAPWGEVAGTARINAPLEKPAGAVEDQLNLLRDKASAAFWAAARQFDDDHNGGGFGLAALLERWAKEAPSVVGTPE